MKPDNLEENPAAQTAGKIEGTSEALSHENSIQPHDMGVNNNPAFESLKRSCIHLGASDHEAIKQYQEAMRLPSKALAVRLGMSILARKFSQHTNQIDNEGAGGRVELILKGCNSADDQYIRKIAEGLATSGITAIIREVDDVES